MLPAFKLLAKLKFLRGTAFDPFGYTAERKVERALIGEYEALVDELLAGLTADQPRPGRPAGLGARRHQGYGHVKDAHLAKARRKQGELLQQWRNHGAGRSRVDRRRRAARCRPATTPCENSRGCTTAPGADMIA